VREAIRGGIETVRRAGKAAGVLAPDRAIADEYLAAGATFVAVGTDTGLLSRAAADLAASYKGQAQTDAAVKGGY
jgi:4-hydroxy-2-oxoheptanedioate aldolase